MLRPSVRNVVKIDTDRLTLREFSDSDAEAIQIYAGDSEVTRYTSFGPNTAEVTAAVLANWILEKERILRLEWPLAIVRRDDGVLIGGTGLGAVDWKTGEAAFGYVLRRSAWGNGYATEAGRAVCEWALNDLGLRRLVAHCEMANTASVAVVDKLGSSREGSVIPPRVNGDRRDYLTFSFERSIKSN